MLHVCIAAWDVCNSKRVKHVKSLLHVPFPGLWCSLESNYIHVDKKNWHTWHYWLQRQRKKAVHCPLVAVTFLLFDPRWQKVPVLASPTQAFSFVLCLSLISTNACKQQWLQPHLCLNRCTSILFSISRWDWWWQSQHDLSKQSKTGSENSGFEVFGARQ